MTAGQAFEPVERWHALGWSSPDPSRDLVGVGVLGLLHLLLVLDSDEVFAVEMYSVARRLTRGVLARPWLDCQNLLSFLFPVLFMNLQCLAGQSTPFHVRVARGMRL